MAERGERATGTPNIIYDLTSVLYHCLESGTSYDQYVRDAEEADDRELIEFFARVRDEDSRRAQEAQLLLAGRTLAAARAQRGTDRAGMTSDEAPPRTEAEFPTRIEDTSRPRRTEEEAPPPPRTSGIEEGAIPTATGEADPGEAAPPRTEGAPSREGVAGDVPRGTEEPTPREREGTGRRPEQERGGDDRGLLERARDALLGEEEPPRRGEGTDRPEDRR